MAQASGLSGLIVSQLETAEQFVLWAFRRRLADGAGGDPELAKGFRLALGLAHVEAGLAGFEGMFAALAEGARHDLVLAPVGCACVSRDEISLLTLVATAQAGEAGRLCALAACFVTGQLCPRLGCDACRLAWAMRLSGLHLRIRPPIAAPSTALH